MKTSTFRESGSSFFNLKDFFTGTFLTLFALLQLSATPIVHDDEPIIPEVKNKETGVVYTNLQTAINDASTTEIQTLKIKGTFVGQFIVDRNIILKGSNDAILDGNQLGRVLTIAGTNIDQLVKIENLTIQNGSISGDNGGGILFAPSTGNPTLYIRNTCVKNNFAEFSGGGLHFIGINTGVGQLTILNSNFFDNNAGAGGGISVFKGNFDLHSSKANRNNAFTLGAGINVQLVDVVNISDSEANFNNSQNQGGGLAFVDNNTINLTDVEIEENRAGHDGGGLFLNGNGVVTLKKVEIEKNNVTDLGGGLYSSNNNSLVLKKVQIEKNFTGVNGGGIYYINTNGGTTFVIDHTKFENNTCGNNGGGLYNSTSGTTTIEHSKFFRNQASDGGAVFNTAGSDLIITDTKFVDNTINDIRDL